MVDTYVPDYADIVWVVLESRVGHEQSGRRPAIVLSNRKFSEHTSLAVVCPITSNAKGLPFEVELQGTSTKGAILPIHVKSIDWKARKVKFIEKSTKIVADMAAESVGAMIGLGG